MMNSDYRLGAVQENSSNALAFGRTVMANERTFLSFIRTGIGLLGGGLGIIGYVKHPLIVGLGWIAIALSVPTLIWGIWRFMSIRKLLNDTKRAVLTKDEQEAGER